MLPGSPDAVLLASLQVKIVAKLASISGTRRLLRDEVIALDTAATAPALRGTLSAQRATWSL